MKIIVNPHSLELEKTIDVNSGEYNIQECEFVFSNEYNELTKMAIFSNEDESFETIISNNKCVIPSEILQNDGTIALGVYGYETNEDKLIKRYSPKPVFLNVELGSYQLAQKSIDPSSDIISQILQQLQNQAQDIITLENNYDNLMDNVIPTLATKEEIPDVSNFVEKDTTDLDNYTLTQDLADVALTGDYEELINKPTIFSGDYNDLTNKPNLSQYATNIQLGIETTNRENADINLQNQIDTITSSSDIRDIVGTYQDLQNYDTSTLGNDDIIKVLQDSTHSNAMTYYRWVISGSTGTWNYIGQEGPYYTKSETETLLLSKQDTLVSGTNIKTINNESILGSGNIDISSGGSDANVYYLGKTDLYNTEETALDLNSLKIGRYYLKHNNNNNTLWIKATYKGNQTEPTTRTLQISLFDDFSSTSPKKPVVVQNTIILYIDKEFTENTTSLSSMGSLTACYKDDSNGFVNYFTMINLNRTAIALGTNSKEKFNLTSQYSTMPTATSGTVGKIVQYTGTTDSTYTNGYFYKCVSDGQSTPTYSWEQLDVQPSSGGSEDVAEIYACDFDSWASVSNTIKEKIYAILNKTTDEKRKILLLNTNRFNGPQLFHCHTIYNDSIIYLSTEGTIQETGNSDTQLKTFSRQIRIYSNRITLTDYKYAVGGPYLASNNDYSTPYTPLYNGSPATKKYVDDSISTAIGTALSSSY